MIEEQDVSCTVCNVMDIGTVIKESDNVTQLKLSGANSDTLQKELTALVKEIESDPCQIDTQKGTDGELEMTLTFSCAAEKYIFEMRARPLIA